MTKKVLLTGAGGGVGCHVLNVILNETDWNVVCTDSFRHLGYSDRIAAILEENQSHRHRVEVLVHDLRGPFSDREVSGLTDIDIIINLASLSDVQASIDDPVPFVTNNVAIVLNMLELARKIEPEVFVQYSTDESFGPADMQFANGHAEWSLHQPSNPYSASKAAQEDIAYAYWRSYGVPVIITHTMNHLAEYQSSTKYPVKIQKAVAAGDTVTVHALSDGSVGSRKYIHSEIGAEALLFILQNTTPTLHKAGHMDRPDKYNIVGDRQIDNLELAQMIAEKMDKPLKYELVNFHDSNPGHDNTYSLDGAKLKSMGFEPKASFDEMLDRTIKFQSSHAEWIK